MIVLNLNKFQKITNLKFNLTDERPIIYFLIQVNENTPRYKRINGQYIHDINGNFVIDEGYDAFQLRERILIYIGETINSLKRLHDHYYDGNIGRIKRKGVGKKFNYVRIIKGFKRFEYDSVRVHEETKLVRKYLPQENQSSQITQKSQMIILNSKGKITPHDLSYPYKIHARDYYKAYKAWEKEDLSIIKDDIFISKRKNKVGIINYKANHFFYNKKRVKIPFHQWFKSVVIYRHKKQLEAMQIWRKNLLNWTKQYAPEYYEESLIKSKSYVKVKNVKQKSLYNKNYRETMKQQKKFMNLLI